MTTYPDQLVAQARTLVRLDPRRPSQANVRRAISAAYYALFHFLIERATTGLYGAGVSTRPLREVLARTYQHGTMKSAASAWSGAHRALSGGKAPSGLSAPVAAALAALGSTVPAELAEIADTFADLQERRHEADYDLTALLTRADAIALISQSERAMKVLWPVIDAHPTTPLFLLSLLVHGQLGRR